MNIWKIKIHIIKKNSSIVFLPPSDLASYVLTKNLIRLINWNRKRRNGEFENIAFDVSWIVKFDDIWQIDSAHKNNFFFHSEAAGVDYIVLQLFRNTQRIHFNRNNESILNFLKFKILSKEQAFSFCIQTHFSESFQDAKEEECFIVGKWFGFWARRRKFAYHSFFFIFNFNLLMNKEIVK